MTHNCDDEIREYQESLDAAINGWDCGRGSMVKLNKHFEKYPALRASWPNDPIPQFGALCKIATARPSIPMELRSRCKRWLQDHGYQPLDDGDVPV